MLGLSREGTLAIITVNLGSKMTKSKTLMAIAYDFDGTLAPGNMQEYNFIPDLGMTPSKFWQEVTEKSKDIEGDSILVYMGLMLKKADATGVKVHRDAFVKYGSEVPLYPGVDSWFERINAYAAEKQIEIDHFIVSSGLREMIEGTPIARYFKKIYASSFWYDHNGVANWPALALNYTTKTQFLFRINKGSLDVWDHEAVNRFVNQSERPVPFSNIIYIGDGETDIPCFRLVKDQGGKSIAVYKSDTDSATKMGQRLINDGRVNYAAPADYSVGSAIEKYVKSIIDEKYFEGQYGE
jgi:hypothetical protein